MRRVGIVCLLLLFALPSFAAKDAPFQVLVWPDSGAPLVRFTFLKFKELSSGMGKEHAYLTDTTAENLTDKKLGNLDLVLYVFDKTHARIGDGNITLSNVGPHETVKFEINLYASGTPASLSVVSNAPRSSSVTINSVPQGAEFKLDGKDMGTTPKVAEVSVGKHMLEFSKQGYKTGLFPFELGPRDASGGSVSYELGAANQDTIELRDGSVLTGDLLSIDTKQVQVRIGGTVQTYDRNQVKRVSLTPRDAAAP